MRVNLSDRRGSERASEGASERGGGDRQMGHLCGLAGRRLILSFAPYTPFYATLKWVGSLAPGPSKVRESERKRRVRERYGPCAREREIWGRGEKERGERGRREIEKERKGGREGESESWREAGMSWRERDIASL